MNIKIYLKSKRKKDDGQWWFIKLRLFFLSLFLHFKDKTEHDKHRINRLYIFIENKTNSLNVLDLTLPLTGVLAHWVFRLHTPKNKPIRCFIYIYRMYKFKLLTTKIATIKLPHVLVEINKKNEKNKTSPKAATTTTTKIACKSGKPTNQMYTWTVITGTFSMGCLLRSLLLLSSISH